MKTEFTVTIFNKKGKVILSKEIKWKSHLVKVRDCHILFLHENGNIAKSYRGKAMSLESTEGL